MLLEGKSALITGGASGIGEASCRLFVEEGASVLIVDRNENAGEALAKELQDLGYNCHFYLADITLSLIHI